MRRAAVASPLLLCARQKLVLLLVPVTALAIGVLVLAPERGAAELLFSQPVSRTAILFGKIIGRLLALVGAEALGFGAAGIVPFSNAGNEGVGGFLLLLVATVVLTAVFLGLAALIGAGVTGRRAAMFRPAPSPPCNRRTPRWVEQADRAQSPGRGAA